MGKERLLSLDVFRGATIAAMILVNDPGSWSSVYAPLLHASWHGLTPTDLVFPFFIFIMGVAISLSKPKTGEDRKAVLIKSLKRTLYLFLIGLFLNGFPYFDFGDIRIPGVLQRIALVFIACLWMHQYVSIRIQYRIGAILLLVYWMLMCFVPVPGQGPANLEPGTNLAAWLDSILLEGHMWGQTKTWDPEGVLGTVPAIVTGMMGMLAGRHLFGSEHKSKALIQLFVAGNAAILVALAWDMHFPINKNLWTSSYVLATGGIAINAFAILYWVLDVQKIKGKWIFPFRVFGLNAITVYAFSGILATLFYLIEIGDNTMQGHIYDALVTVFTDLKFSSLIYAILFTSVCYIPVWVMYKKGIFLKV